MKTFCLECGVNVKVDEEGLCMGCGAVAVGAGVDRLAEEIKHLRAENEQLREAVDHYANPRRCLKGHEVGLLAGCPQCRLEDENEWLRRELKVFVDLMQGVIEGDFEPNFGTQRMIQRIRTAGKCQHPIDQMVGESPNYFCGICGAST